MGISIGLYRWDAVSAYKYYYRRRYPSDNDMGERMYEGIRSDLKNGYESYSTSLYKNENANKICDELLKKRLPDFNFTRENRPRYSEGNKCYYDESVWKWSLK